MTEEALKPKSDLRHTMSARARAESREKKARDSLKVAEVELRGVMDGLQAQHKTKTGLPRNVTIS